MPPRTATSAWRPTACWSRWCSVRSRPYSPSVTAVCPPLPGRRRCNRRSCRGEHRVRTSLRLCGSNDRDGFAGRRQVEAGGVVVTARPLQHLPALRAWRPGEEFFEFAEAVAAATVLRRACAPTGDASRVDTVVCCYRARLDDELVLPAIAEVILVLDPVRCRRQVGEPECPLVEIAQLVIGVRLSVAHASDPESVQVIVLPAHRR